ncbi:hypothetical protein F5Y19DRAFT_488881 [Xylariaceae sp. FL1651]|nr:hypothetical protein F5Y19DRAFT_488881 [Xylariaceae sp. FL1651]
MPDYSIYDGVHGLVPTVTRAQLGLISAFMTLSLWLALEFHVHVFHIFKAYHSLYFWSLLFLAWGIILHSIGYLLNWFVPNCPWEVYALVDAIGWSMMVTAESLVLYSRMHLVTRKRSVHRFILGMIIFTALFVQIPNLVISIPAVDSNLSASAVWSPRDSIETRIQQVSFLLQESIISSLYIWYAAKILKPSLHVRQRRVMLDLVYVNVAVIFLDVVVVLLAFTNQRLIKDSLQNLSYALKLKLEFFVLNQLMEVFRDGFSNKPGMKGRYRAQSASIQKSNEKNDSEGSRGIEFKKQYGWSSTDPRPSTNQDTNISDPKMPENTYFGTGNLRRQRDSPLPTRPTSTADFSRIDALNLSSKGLSNMTMQDMQHVVSRESACDEDWPTCGTCRRAKRNCSGPPSSIKFVHNGNRTPQIYDHGGCQRDESSGQKRSNFNSAMLLSDDLIELEKAQEDKVMLLQVRQRAAGKGGGMFAKMRRMKPTDLRVPLPGQIPRNCIDNVAAQVVHCIESTVGTEYDLVLRISWAGLAPRRLQSSPAFCAAISLFISTWAKVRRFTTPNPTMVLDRKAYGKALGFIRLALRNPRQTYDAGTLAAIALIHQIDVDFGGQRCIGTSSSHAAGLYALMAARGPPQLNDELDVHLCFENMCRLVMHLIVSEKDNFYTHMDWANTMQLALRSSIIRHPSYKNLYVLQMQLAQWPALAVESRRFHLNPSPVWGAQIVARAAELLRRLREFEMEKIQPLWESKSIWTVPDSAAPWAEAYHFSDWPTSQILIMHASISIVAVRILAAALEQLRKPDPSLDERALEWSQQIWKSQAYIDQFRIAVVNSVASLILSYESATGRTRDVILAKLQSVNHSGHNHIPTDSVLMKTCMIATGRLPYPDPFPC